MRLVRMLSNHVLLRMFLHRHDLADGLRLGKLALSAEDRPGRGTAVWAEGPRIAAVGPGSGTCAHVPTSRQDMTVPECQTTSQIKEVSLTVRIGRWHVRLQGTQGQRVEEIGPLF